MSDSIYPARKVAKTMNGGESNGLAARHDPATTRTTSNPVQNSPSVTLRRAVPPDRRQFVRQSVALHDLWAGQRDTMTLYGVEVVSGTEADARGPIGTSLQQNQNSTLGDGLMNTGVPQSGSTTPLAQSSSAFLPQRTVMSDLNDTNRWAATAHDNVWDLPDGGLLPMLDMEAHNMLVGGVLTPPHIFNWEDHREAYGFPPATAKLSRPNGPGTCRACLETLQSPVVLPCDHSYCRSCLNRLVSIGLANRSSFPPRCCTGRRGIDMAAIQAHLDKPVLMRYFDIVEEFSSPNPIYCANQVCSRYIEQSRIANNPGKFVTCGECPTQTCTECKQGLLDHTGEDGRTCKKVEELMNDGDRQLAQSNQWKQCPGCKNLVEKIEGCNHMHCDCGTDFCYKCGIKMEDYAPCNCYAYNRDEWLALAPQMRTVPDDGTDMLPQVTITHDPRDVRLLERVAAGAGNANGSLASLRQAARAARATRARAVRVAEQAVNHLQRGSMPDELRQAGGPGLGLVTPGRPSSFYATDNTPADSDQTGSGQATRTANMVSRDAPVVRSTFAPTAGQDNHPPVHGEGHRRLKREVGLVDAWSLPFQTALGRRPPPEYGTPPAPMSGPTLSPIREAASPDRVQIRPRARLPALSQPRTQTHATAVANNHNDNTNLGPLGTRQREEIEAWRADGPVTGNGGRNRGTTGNTGAVGRAPEPRQATSTADAPKRWSFMSMKGKDRA